MRSPGRGASSQPLETKGARCFKNFMIPDGVGLELQNFITSALKGNELILATI